MALAATLTALALAVPQGSTGLLPAHSPAREAVKSNVLIVLADDLGVDQLAAYGEGSDLPVTPTLDALAAEGVLFRNAWSQPVCSPTRAGIVTGRYGFRTGVGTIVNTEGAALPLEEWTLPDALDFASGGWEHALIGKWHLGNSSVGGILSPNLAGWDHFDGTLFALEPAPQIGYYSWPRIVNGAAWTAGKYNTTAVVDGAVSWIARAPEPWLCFVSFHAPHGPYHAPPRELHYEDLTGLPPPAQGGPLRPHYKAMIEAMDTELGRLLGAVDALTSSETLILFAGDNGTPDEVTVPPFFKQHAKGTLYEGGVNVPLIAAGWDVIPAEVESSALVHTNDLFATVADVAGIDLAATFPNLTLDSRSFLPLLLDPVGAPSRKHVFAESFAPVGLPVPPNAMRAIRDGRFKLIRGAQDEFYDLVTDPFETSNLLPGKLSPPQQAAYDALAAALNQILAS